MAHTLIAEATTASTIENNAQNKNTQVITTIT
jgi:hypothetical protein